MKKGKVINPVKKRIQDELTTCQSIIDKVKSYDSIIPQIEEFKDEAELKLCAIEKLPEDFHAEITPHLLIADHWDFEPLRSFNDSLPKIDTKGMRYVSTSGTSACIINDITESYPVLKFRPAWATQVISQFSDIADIKAKRDSLPQAINALNSNLGQEFINAEESIHKSKAGIIQPHQAASSMRNLIQQIWGEFVERARAINREKLTTKRYELKKPLHRKEISDLIAQGADGSIFEERLSSLYGVYQDLSSLAKKTDTECLNLLVELRTRWILVLDSLRSFYI